MNDIEFLTETLDQADFLEAIAGKQVTDICIILNGETGKPEQIGMYDIRGRSLFQSHSVLTVTNIQDSLWLGRSPAGWIFW